MLLTKIKGPICCRNTIWTYFHQTTHELLIDFPLPFETNVRNLHRSSSIPCNKTSFQMPTKSMTQLYFKDHKERRRKQRRRKDLQWLDSQVQQQKSWTQFSYPLHRLEYCYNLRSDVYNKIRIDYLSGTSEDTHAEPKVPRSMDLIRQDILAIILIIGYGLFRSEFVTAKQLATKRNIRKAASPEVEKTLWPARPDLFQSCPEPLASAASDDEIANFFRYRFYGDKIAEIDENSEDYRIISEGSVGSSESSDQHANVGAYVDTETGFSNETNICDGQDTGMITDEMDTLPENYVSAPPTMTGKAINNKSIMLLKDLCLTLGRWGSVGDTQRKYKIGKSKAHEVRSAVKALREGAIEGITWDMFSDTFKEIDLMQMTLQKSKEESIRQAISIFNSK